jgi:hypothetical protein
VVLGSGFVFCGVTESVLSTIIPCLVCRLESFDAFERKEKRRERALIPHRPIFRLLRSFEKACSITDSNGANTGSLLVAYRYKSYSTTSTWC